MNSDQTRIIDGPPPEGFVSLTEAARILGVAHVKLVGDIRAGRIAPEHVAKATLPNGRPGYFVNLSAMQSGQSCARGHDVAESR